jgi:hypothetical protein
MCPSCEGFTEKTPIRQPWEYFKLVRQLESLVSRKVLMIDRGTCDLSELQANQKWPGDIIEHQFVCCQCDQKFTLSVDTYHGNGSWEAI